MIDFSNENYEKIRTRMLNNINANVDKRETSIADLSIAPMALELSTLYELLNQIQNNSWILTAEGESLDNKCLERGIVRKQPTKAIKMAYFNLQVDKDVEFSTIGLENALVYKTTEQAAQGIDYELSRLDYTIGLLSEKVNIGYFYASDNNTFYKDGIEIVVNRVSILPAPSSLTVGLYYLDENDMTLYVGIEQVLYKANVECQTEGSIGNNYTGNIIPIVNIQDLTTAYIEELVLVGTDVESDLSLRTRYLASLGSESFAGNIQSYRTYALSINGVGGVQVYPHYKGPGTVKLSIIDSQYNQATQTLIDIVQNAICPPEENDNTPSPLGYGMAPIGAKVDIGTSTDLTVNLTFDVTLMQGKTVSDIQTKVENAFEDYLLMIRQGWGDALITNEIIYPVNIYISQLTSKLLQIEEILNITNLQLNGSASDIQCVEKADYSSTPAVDIQQLPIKGTVVITQV